MTWQSVFNPEKCGFAAQSSPPTLGPAAQSLRSHNSVTLKVYSEKNGFKLDGETIGTLAHVSCT